MGREKLLRSPSLQVITPIYWCSYHWRWKFSIFFCLTTDGACGRSWIPTHQWATHLDAFQLTAAAKLKIKMNWLCETVALEKDATICVQVIIHKQVNILWKSQSLRISEERARALPSSWRGGKPHISLAVWSAIGQRLLMMMSALRTQSILIAWSSLALRILQI